MNWAKNYQRSHFHGDLIAGLIVAIMLVPQSMAYAMIAGLPPETGLYASIFPILVYAFLGTSNYLAVGPVAIVALMVAGTATDFARPGSPEYHAVALTLALLSGVLLLLFGLLRFGRLVNFLSHPVINGFINAAAVVIAASQLQHLLGLDIPNNYSVLAALGYTFSHLQNINIATFIISIVTLLFLVMSREPLGRFLLHLKVRDTIIATVTKTGALVVLIVGTLVVWIFELHIRFQIAIVETVPSGLPPFTMPELSTEIIRQLLPGALLIAFVTFMESVSVTRSLASKKRQRVKPNRELLALGGANLAAAFSSAFPVAGGFSRSGVNFTAGANTQLSAIVTAILIALTILLFALFFYYLPKAVLAAVVWVAILRLIDINHIMKAWKFNRADAVSSIVTFVAVIVTGVETGILIGAALSIALYVWRTTQPHIAIVGRLGDTEHYRNVKNYEVKTCRHVVGIRIDESLYFANVHALEDKLLEITAEQPEVQHIVLICSAINFVDYSALESLEATLERLHAAGVTLHLAEVKIPVLKKMQEINIEALLGKGKIYLSTHAAMQDLGCS